MSCSENLCVLLSCPPPRFSLIGIKRLKRRERIEDEDKEERERERESIVPEAETKGTRYHSAHDLIIR